MAWPGVRLNAPTKQKTLQGRLATCDFPSVTQMIALGGVCAHAAAEDHFVPNLPPQGPPESLSPSEEKKQGSGHQPLCDTQVLTKRPKAPQPHTYAHNSPTLFIPLLWKSSSLKTQCFKGVQF